MTSWTKNPQWCQADRYNVYARYKKFKAANTPRSRQFDTCNQAVVNIEDLMSLFPQCFTGLGKFHVEPYHIEVDPSESPKKTPCRPLPTH